VLELFEVRAVLERHAVESALPLPDVTTALDPVREALERMRGAEGDLERDDAHREFHASIVSLAGNRQLDVALAPVLLKLQLPMARNLREEGRRRAGDGIARHQRLIEALESNDSAVVLAALVEHGHLDYLGLKPGAEPAAG
jgi:DNA-binding GntR family transcriptional regulator